MKSLINNILFTSACLVIISGASFLLYREFTSFNVKSSTEQIGTITFKRNIAQRQVASQKIWDSLRNNSPIYDFDSIRTDTNSEAVLNLNDGTSLNISENSFIVVSLSKNGFNLDFNRGSISANRKNINTSKTLTIQSGQTEINLQKGDLNLKGDNKSKLAVNLSGGTASIKSGNEIANLDENKVATIVSGKTEIKENPFILKEPGNDIKFITSRGSQVVNFSWLSKLKKNNQLVISTDLSFNKITARKKSSLSNKAELSTGTYYWKIVNNNLQSSIQKITILNDSAPIITSPIDNKIISFITKIPIITLKWTKTKAGNYTVKISKDKNFQSLIKEISTINNEISFDDLNEGEYFCKVENRYNFPSQNKIPSSKITKFIVTKKSELTAPEVILAGNRKRISSEILKSKGTFIYWQGDKESASYTFELSSDKKFSNIIFKKETQNKNIFIKEDLDNKNYYFRVIANSANKDFSKNSKNYILDVVKIQNLSLISPANNSSFSIFDPLKITWSDPNMGNNYIIEVSKDKDYKKIINSFETSKNNLTIDNMKEGSFFVRVTLVDENKNKIISSGTNRIIIAEKLEAPEIKWPYDSDSLDASNINALNIQWKSPRGANTFNVKLVYIESGNRETTITSASTQKNEFSYNKFNKLNEGNFYWEINAMQTKGKKVLKKSNINKKFFKIFTKKVDVKPDIKSSKVIYVD